MQHFDKTGTKGSLDILIEFLNQFKHPALLDGWASFTHKSHQNIVTKTHTGEFIITFPFAAKGLLTEFTDWFTRESQQYLDIPDVSIDMKVVPLKANDKAPVKGVKNIIVVSSGKGGVGKSTTAVNLALGLQAQGARVGLLDADIYGPSLPLMLGTIGQSPNSIDGKMMEPVMAHGLQTNSIGYLVPDENAMVWRGPMASKAFAQLVMETRWQNVDYLVVDMPPGTGDIQLSLAQQFPVTGAIVVTTPQDLALADAIKGVAMFDKVEVPVLGIVENMSYYICPSCGHHEEIFGQGGAMKMAKSFDLSILGQIPLDIGIREDLDKGKPTVISNPNSEHAKAYTVMALRVASQLYWTGTPTAEQISVSLK